MAVTTNNLLLEKNNQIIYNGIKMELFVPMDFFKKDLAELIGNQYKIFGTLISLHYMNKDDSRSKAKRAELLYPLKFNTIPDEVSEEKLDFGEGETKYKVFTYYKDAIFMTDASAVEDIDNLSYFLIALMGGRLDFIDYDKLPALFQYCKYLTNGNTGIPASFEEILIAEYSRSPSDPSKGARFDAAFSDKMHYKAKGITEREKVSYTSTFAAISYEDLNTMLTTADNAYKDKRPNNRSKVELAVMGEL